MLNEVWFKIFLNILGSTLSLGYFVIFFLDFRDFAVRHYFLFCSGLSNAIITGALWFDIPNIWVIRAVLFAYVGCLLSILTSSAIRFWGACYPFSFPKHRIHYIVQGAICLIRVVSALFGFLVPMEEDVLGYHRLPIMYQTAFEIFCFAVILAVVFLNLRTTHGVLDSPKYKTSPKLSSIMEGLKSSPGNQTHSSLRFVVNAFVTNLMFILCWMPIVLQAEFMVVKVAIPACELLSLFLYAHLMGHSWKRLLFYNLACLGVVVVCFFGVLLTLPVKLAQDG